MKTEMDVLSTLALVLNKDMFDQVLEWKEDSDKLKELKEAVSSTETDNENEH